MNQVRIYTDRELTETEIEKIRSIMMQSQCPNESLHYTFEDCRIDEEGDIVFGMGDLDSFVLEY